MGLPSGRGDRDHQSAGGLFPFALKQRPRWLAAAAVGAAAVAVALGAVCGQSTGDRVGSELRPPLASPPPPAPARPPAVAAGFRRFWAPQGRFSIDYPSDWARLETPRSDVKLLAARGEAASVLVRTIALRSPVGRSDLENVEALTDRIVASGQQVRLLAEARRIELGGLPGYFYFYSFRDPKTRRRGTHSHYFLFQGATLITIVLQALPERRFERFASDFDRIAASFRARR